MKLTPQIQKALNTATHLHQGQARKGEEFPYIVHPYSVAIILSEYTADENILIAGLLHDTLEDCAYTPEQLTADFGEKVASIVQEVTEDFKLKEAQGTESSWVERKSKYLEHLKVASPEAMMVCAADKIHNLRSMYDAYQIHGPKLWIEFNSPIEKKLWFYGEVLKVVKERLESGIVEELEDFYLSTLKCVELDKY